MGRRIVGAGEYVGGWILSLHLPAFLYRQLLSSCRWTTHWFEVKFVIPEDWSGSEVRFRWDSDSEAMVGFHWSCFLVLFVCLFDVLQ